MNEVDKLNMVLDEMSDMQDEMCENDTAKRLLFNRWRTEIASTRNHFDDIIMLRSDLKAAMSQRDVAERELLELRRRLADAKATSYISSEAAKRMVKAETDALQVIGLLNEFLMHIHDKQWISAIKVYRQALGGGLKECKDRVEFIGGVVR